MNPRRMLQAGMLAGLIGWTPVPADGLPTRIAFGSCAHQDKPLPVFETIVGQRPDLFLFLGDNIYGDTADMAELQAKYDRLGTRPEYLRLKAAMPILATWDDHDYGANDAGREYPQKEASKRIFQNFFQVGPDRPSRTRPGIYEAYRFEQAGTVLQILLLDTRTFRDPLRRNPRERPANAPWKNDYQPDPDPGKTLLGPAQWQWLQEQLSQPADLRLIGSSIQFGHEYNGWESWTNLPAERQRMIDLITRTRANGVLFLSGDVHWAELSRREELPGGYPLYDLTASGLNREWDTVEPNRHRVGDPVREHHFGLVDIDWHAPEPSVTLRILDVPGTVRLEHRIRLQDLRFR